MSVAESSFVEISTVLSYPRTLAVFNSRHVYGDVFKTLLLTIIERKLIKDK